MHEHALFIGDFPIETSIYSGFPIAMFDNRRVLNESVLVIMAIAVDHMLQITLPGSFESQPCP